MYNQSFFLYEEEMFLSGDIYIFVFFGESKSFKICELVVKLRVLRSIRMKFGQILVQPTKTIPTPFFINCGD